MTTYKDEADRRFLAEERRKNYLEKAEAAARMERVGNYGQAKDLWALAEKYAGNRANQNWCNHRFWFCNRMKNRPFKGE